MTALVFLESRDDEVSRQAVAFASQLGEPVSAVSIGGAYAPRAWGQALAAAVQEREASSILGPGSERGNEVLAHAAAALDRPMAANCVSLTPGQPARVRRLRWGGSLLEEAVVHGAPLILTVAPHVVEAAAEVEVTELEAGADADVQVRERVRADGGGVSLADASVVVSGGRGVGSAEGFAVIEELAELLGAAVGCSRAVTMAGWRPHTDQVGQTGTKIAPDIYIACGISGATQHMAGAKGAKKLLAINPDAEASIFTSADYAVIGDLHEVVPAISNEIRKTRGS
ncbi:MAG TPA: electron transfer flavoprotein subunit alpha/FixB family protein [Solirubrobacteraceae bacterium]|nr:electron transfer flavoprotein subunit alpha/FixB family protein [Solirubrobacteraceae bacterium]